MPDKWSGYANFKERNERAEKVPGHCIYVNENNSDPPQAVRQYWDGGSWVKLADPVEPAYYSDNAAPVGRSFAIGDQEVRGKEGKSGAGTDEKGPYGLIENYPLPWELEEAWLDGWMFFPGDFDWDHSKSSGKIYGLSSCGDDRLAGGQNGTGNCGPVKPEAWSSRCTFKTGGYFQLYAYHQNRPGDCGHKFAWNGAAVPKGEWVRYTQRVKVNTPGEPDGEFEVWINGEQRLLKTDLEWRGVVTDEGMSEKSQRALIANVKVMHYFGGNDESGPRWDCEAGFRDFVVQDFPPDFSTGGA